MGVMASLAILYAAVATFRPSIRPYWGNGARCGKLTCIAFGVCFAAIASAVFFAQHLLGFVAIGVFLFSWLAAVVGFFQDARSFREAKQRDLTN